MLQKRQKLILQLLYDSNKPLLGKQLAERIDVTSRTIRTDIKILNEVLRQFRMEIASSKRDGYYVSEEQRDILAKVIVSMVGKRENLIKVPNTPSERVVFIIFKLAFSVDYISMENLANMIFVSKTTINYDVKKIIEFLKPCREVNLIVSPLKGLLLTGSEKGKRMLLSDLLNRGGNIKEFLLLSQRYPYIYLGEQLDKEGLFLFETIVNVLNRFGYSLTDRDVGVLVTDILISVKRIQMGCHIEPCEECVDIRIVSSFVDDIKNFFHVEIDAQEMTYFQQRFNAKRLLGVSNSEYKYAEETEKIIDLFLAEIKTRFALDFSRNLRFKNNLILHINPMINRLAEHRFEENALLGEIKKVYSFAFEIATLIIEIIKERLHVVINESEVAYIALHVAVALEESYERIQVAIICGSGLSMAELLKRKLLSYFNSQVNIVGQFSLYQLNNIVRGDFGKVDLIVTVLPIKVEHIPVVQVNPLIMEEDLTKIRQYLNNPFVLNHRLYRKKSDYSFFKKNLFEYFDKETGYLDCLKILTKRLSKENVISDEQGFFESVVQRENLYSTILDGMIAIPHPLESYSKTTLVAVGVLKEAVRYCGKKVKLVLLFAVNTKESEKLQLLFAMLEDLLDSKEKLNELMRCTSYEDFIEKLEQA
ncbi:BglG family transcription antiterminator [Anaerosinus massiliensis]|uniref:BglG family transcription antiterminator n=1 Tax=Massilibacillus massiliensis TaxID=1806837 RepID=UPI000DA63846|nr:PTS sugar transporter subunit IIA [Massilibacillus massiliensis]